MRPAGIAKVAKCGPRRRAWLLLCVCLFARHAETAPAYALDPPGARAERVARAVRTRHTRGHYPGDLLVNPPPEGAASGSGAESGGRPRTPRAVFGGRDAPAPVNAPWDWDIDLPSIEFPDWLERWLSGLSPVLRLVVKVLLYGALLAVGLALGYLLLHARLPRRPDAPPDAAKRDRRGSVGQTSADPLLAAPTLSHEELARLGRYTEAVHALFVDALVRSGFTGEGQARGRTAREVVAAYDAAGRESLSDLLGRTERCWFGGVLADAAAYEHARDVHSAFVGSLPT